MEEKILVETEDIFDPYELAEDVEPREIEIERPAERIEKRIIEVVNKESKEQVLKVYIELYKKSFLFDYSHGVGKFKGIDQGYRDACYLYLFFQFNSLMKGEKRMLMSDRYMKQGMGFGMERIREALSILKREKYIKIYISGRKINAAKRYITLY